MRVHVDWEDGGIGWDGPEILPAEEPDDEPVDDDELDGLFFDYSDDEPVDADPVPSAGPDSALPVLWKPFPALLPAGETGDWSKVPTMPRC
jgi:hypothetical protein